MLSTILMGCQAKAGQVPAAAPKPQIGAEHSNPIQHICFESLVCSFTVILKMMGSSIQALDNSLDMRGNSMYNNACSLNPLQTKSLPLAFGHAIVLSSHSTAH